MKTRVHRLTDRELSIVYIGGNLPYTPDQSKYIEETASQTNQRRIDEGKKPFRNGPLFPIDISEGPTILQ